jgi:hypothetical protein
MKRTLAAIALALSTSAAAQTTAPGPYYATPSWDQTLPSSSRFVILSNFNNEAVLDRETGLVWTRSDAGPLNWTDAHHYCVNFPPPGSGLPVPRLGWRLPTVQEATSLLETSDGLAGLNSTAFNVSGNSVWTATTVLSESSAWIVHPTRSQQPVSTGSKELGAAQVLCVRSSAHGLDAQ